jgi:hypothetical protein
MFINNYKSIWLSMSRELKFPGFVMLLIGIVCAKKKGIDIGIKNEKDICGLFIFGNFIFV